jgi:FkbM family methyltransferase
MMKDSWVGRRLLNAVESVSPNLRLYMREARKIGLVAAARLDSRELPTSQPAEPKLGKVHFRGYRHPFYFRYGASDSAVIRQIFCDEEYGAWLGGEVRTIVDCGANIGCSAFYLLNKYPNARLIAIEPDPANFELCKKNLAAFGERAVAIQAGIWPTDGPLRVDRGSFRDGLAWSFQVRKCEPGEPADVQGLSLTTLLAEQHIEQLDFLKIDIERSEIQLFAEGFEPWLDRTRNLAIELHDDECIRVFYAALDAYEFDSQRSGELAICRNLARRQPAAAAH